jgi:hypothetical protein
MANAEALGKEITTLLAGVGTGIYAKFSQEDKADLENYAKNVARLAVRLQTETDPAARVRIQDNLNTFLNAARLMLVRYELIAANAVEQAAVAALKLATETVLKLVLALV